MIGPSEKRRGMSVVRKVCFKKEKGGRGVKGKRELKGNLMRAPWLAWGATPSDTTAPRWSLV